MWYTIIKLPSIGKDHTECFGMKFFEFLDDIFEYCFRAIIDHMALHFYPNCSNFVQTVPAWKFQISKQLPMIFAQRVVLSPSPITCSKTEQQSLSAGSGQRANLTAFLVFRMFKNLLAFDSIL